MGQNPTETIAVIYGNSPQYVKEVLLILQLFKLRQRRNCKLYALKWDKEKFAADALVLTDDLQILKINSDRMPKPGKCIILDLPKDKEIFLHKRISGFLQKKQIRQLNSFPASLTADDKYKTLSILSRENLKVPESMIINMECNEREILDNLLLFIKRNSIESFYIQPNFGTEGRETYFIRQEQLEKNPEEILGIIKTILPGQPVIIRKKRGNVYFRNTRENGYRQIVFRILVHELNGIPENDYGFAEISSNKTSFISSPEKGGMIIGFKKAFLNLFYLKETKFKRLVLSGNEIESIRNNVMKAYKCFNARRKAKLEFCGIDFVLEVHERGISPVFLEINPRPAGLNKLEEFSY